AIASLEDISRGKPDPQVFLVAAAKVGVIPARSVVFEDAPVGIQAAKAAGMHAVGLTTTHPTPALWDAGADEAVAHLGGYDLAAPDYDLHLFPFPDRGGWRGKAETLLRPYSYMFGPDLRQALGAALAQGFDVLHLEQLWSGWLGLEHVDRALVNVHYLSAIDLG